MFLFKNKSLSGLIKKPKGHSTDILLKIESEIEKAIKGEEGAIPNPLGISEIDLIKNIGIHDRLPLKLEYEIYNKEKGKKDHISKQIYEVTSADIDNIQMVFDFDNEEIYRATELSSDHILYFDYVFTINSMKLIRYKLFKDIYLLPYRPECLENAKKELVKIQKIAKPEEGLAVSMIISTFNNAIKEYSSIKAEMERAEKKKSEKKVSKIESDKKDQKKIISEDYGIKKNETVAKEIFSTGQVQQKLVKESVLDYLTEYSHVDRNKCYEFLIEKYADLREVKDVKNALRENETDIMKFINKNLVTVATRMSRIFAGLVSENDCRLALENFSGDYKKAEEQLKKEIFSNRFINSLRIDQSVFKSIDARAFVEEAHKKALEQIRREQKMAEENKYDDEDLKEIKRIQARYHDWFRKVDAGVGGKYGRPESGSTNRRSK